MTPTTHDRRRRCVYTTQNTDYHLFDDVCVAVRDRRSGRWQVQHLALDVPMAGAVRLHGNGAAIPHPGRPRLGEALYFTLPTPGRERQLITSRVKATSRPSKEELRRYPAHAAVSAAILERPSW